MTLPKFSNSEIPEACRMMAKVGKRSGVVRALAALVSRDDKGVSRAAFDITIVRASAG